MDLRDRAGRVGVTSGGPASLRRLAGRTVELIDREYPNGIRLTLQRPPTGRITPRSIYPAFFGCYDWHSAVHSHWQVVRVLRSTDDPGSQPPHAPPSPGI